MASLRPVLACDIVVEVLALLGLAELAVRLGDDLVILCTGEFAGLELLFSARFGVAGVRAIFDWITPIGTREFASRQCIPRFRSQRGHVSYLSPSQRPQART